MAKVLYNKIINCVDFEISVYERGLKILDNGEWKLFYVINDKLVEEKLEVKEGVLQRTKDGKWPKLPPPKS
jgi:hypothetical protein